MDERIFFQIINYLSKSLDLPVPELKRRIVAARGRRRDINTLRVDEQKYANKLLITNLIDNYYHNNRTNNIQRKKYLIDGIELPTTVFIKPEVITNSLKLTNMEQSLISTPDWVNPPKITKILREAAPMYLEYIDAIGLKIWNDPLYRLLGMGTESQLALSFALTDFITYRFTSGLLPDELKFALINNRGKIEPILRDPEKHLPLRQAIIPTTQDFFNFNSRICAGGIGAVIAMRREKPYDDYLVLYQVRSNNVNDGQGQYAMIPKAFHQPQFGCEAEEVNIYWTLMREMFEEIYGHAEAEHEAHRSKYDWYFAKEPGLQFFKEKRAGQSYIIETTGFGVNALGGNYDIGILIIITDTGYYGHEFLSSWETEKIKHFYSKEKGSIKELLLSSNPSWVNESIPQIIEGLLKLKQFDPTRVSLPDIQRVF